MSRSVVIALDVMGGDKGPALVLQGAALMLERQPNVRFMLFGQAPKVEPLLSQYPALARVSTFQHADIAIRMDEKPVQALRAGRPHSSLWKTLEAVRDGHAHVAVSAGNTGALMAMAKFCLTMMPGVDRPAIAALWPTVQGESIVLDVGATIGADAQRLITLSVMGAVLAQAIFDYESPTVGLINVGSEEIKGLESVREAHSLLKNIPPDILTYKGFIEGDDLGQGTVNVAVTEGWAGNIALKTAEGTAKQIRTYLHDALCRSWQARLGAWFARSAFTYLKEKMDPRHANGGIFLGLNGLVVKSHGGADAIGIASALSLAHTMASHDLYQTMRTALNVALSDSAILHPPLPHSAHDSNQNG